MKINLEFVNALLEMRKVINQTKLEDIELYEKGERIEITKEIIDEWQFMGLSNIDFYETRFWESEYITPDNLTSIDGK